MADAGCRASSPAAKTPTTGGSAQSPDAGGFDRHRAIVIARSCARRSLVPPGRQSVGIPGTSPRVPEISQLRETTGVSGLTLLCGVQLIVGARYSYSVPQLSVGQAAELLGQSTRVTKDKVIAQVDVHAGAFRVVWLVAGRRSMSCTFRRARWS